MQWFQYTVSRETDGHAEVRSGLIQADTPSEAADLIEQHYGGKGTVVSVQPWKEPGV